jgi:hypothetical protein
VLDVDPGRGGDATLAELERENGTLPETLQQQTGGGGAHFLFETDEQLRNAVDFAPGLDFRADGGYIVAPPAGHASGRRYAWMIGFAPGEVPLAPLPRWLRERLRIPRRHRASEGPIRRGRRNATLASIAGWLRSRGMGEPELRAKLHAVNRARCVPPLPHHETGNIARSIARYEVGPSLSKVAEAIRHFPWQGEAGGTDSMVLRAHLDCCRRGQAQHDASARDLADRAGITRATVGVSHRRLREAGWLQLLQPARGGHAARWRLCLPSARSLGSPDPPGPHL